MISDKDYLSYTWSTVEEVFAEFVPELAGKLSMVLYPHECRLLAKVIARRDDELYLQRSRDQDRQRAMKEALETLKMGIR